VFFALSVAFTMLSAQSLDPRLIWDSAEPEKPLNA
jgi:paraquat-inducible protein A